MKEGMENTLKSAYSKDSAENAARLTRNDDRVNVDVEDNMDADFWKDLLESLCPHKEFHFVPLRFTRGNDVHLTE